MSEKVIRDPVHDVIAFRTDRPVDALLFNLLNATEVQRLRRIRQLGMASLAYPGADHSRYSHSLGVMETARKMLNRLRAFFSIDEEMECICLVASLLHDLGHGPFSHVFERVSGIHHELTTRRVIEDQESDVHRLLSAHDPQLPTKIVRFLACQPTRSLFNDILSSQLDADRFDYLLRDNLMTGSQYGSFDLGWLLQAITFDESGDRLAITAKGISAAEAYLQARYHMYRNVYFHKVVRSAEGMVKLALQLARRLAIQDRLPWPPREHYVHKALLGQTLTIPEFLQLDDIAILMCFKTWTTSDDPTLARLCHGILYRRLYKVIDVTSIATEDSQAQSLYRRAEQAISQANGDPTYDLFFDEPANTPYVSHPDTPNGSPGQILIYESPTQITDFAHKSPLVTALDRQLTFRRIHVAEDHRDAVHKAITSRTI